MRSILSCMLLHSIFRDVDYAVHPKLHLSRGVFDYDVHPRDVYPICFRNVDYVVHSAGVLVNQFDLLPGLVLRGSV